MSCLATCRPELASGHSTPGPHRLAWPSTFLYLTRWLWDGLAQASVARAGFWAVQVLSSGVATVMLAEGGPGGQELLSWPMEHIKGWESPAADESQTFGSLLAQDDSWVLVSELI